MSFDGFHNISLPICGKNENENPAWFYEITY
jgi:hypothetical protein